MERSYWQAGTGVGFIFDLGTAVGFIVGIVIVYQILYSDVYDHLPEYATLKSMGYTDNYLLVVLIKEALLLAILGFLPRFIFILGKEFCDVKKQQLTKLRRQIGYIFQAHNLMTFLTAKENVQMSLELHEPNPGSADITKQVRSLHSARIFQRLTGVSAAHRLNIGNAKDLKP